MKLYLVIFILTLWGVNCQHEDFYGEGIFSGDFMHKEAEIGAENFGIKLFANIAKEYSNVSLIMSPYSIWSVLKLAYYGSAGETEAELKAILGGSSKREAFWVSYIIEIWRKIQNITAFSSFDQAYFADEAQSACSIQMLDQMQTMNFSNPSRIINPDISKATRGEINDFVTGIQISKARFILINALYFNGKWTTQFDKLNTKSTEFFDETGLPTKKKALMMNVENRFNYVKSNILDAEILELPYREINFSMLIIFPSKSQTVNNVLDLLTASRLKTEINNLRPKTLVNVNLPAFHFNTKLDRVLHESLTNLNIKTLFDPTSADLREFLPCEKLALTNALHEATISVDEEGTVAATVSGLITTMTGAERPVRFTANRPFLFIIRDNCVDITYFIGVYRDPADSVKLS